MSPQRSAPILEVQGLVKEFPVRGGRVTGAGRRVVHAVTDVSFRLFPHETLGIVGESGCGKSTLARSAIRLIDPTAGSILYNGSEITSLSNRQLRRLRSKMQIVFQDPYASLDPRMKVRDLVLEPVRAQSGGQDRDVEVSLKDALDAVGISSNRHGLYPHEFSGGQRQRICIARALMLKPDIVVLDEAVSALDVSIQAQILNLVQDLQRERGLAYIFVSHDLSVVRHVSDRIMVMYLGRVMETGRADSVYDHPRHPYTQALLSAAPSFNGSMQRERIVLAGDVPSPITPPSGCPFRTRCWKAQPICAEVLPPLRELDDGRLMSCHFPDD